MHFRTVRNTISLNNVEQTHIYHSPLCIRCYILGQTQFIKVLVFTISSSQQKRDYRERCLTTSLSFCFWYPFPFHLVCRSSSRKLQCKFSRLSVTRTSNSSLSITRAHILQSNHSKRLVSTSQALHNSIELLLLVSLRVIEKGLL